MKYLLVLLVIVIAVGVWRSRRRAENLQARRPAARADGRLQPPQDMVACAHCGLHLPRSDALVLGNASRPACYCTAEHRAPGPA